MPFSYRRSASTIQAGIEALALRNASNSTCGSLAAIRSNVAGVTWQRPRYQRARRDVLQSHLQLADAHSVRRACGVEDRLGRNLGAKTKTASCLGTVHFDGCSFARGHRMRHCFRRRHGLQAKTAGLGNGIEATAESLNATLLGQAHQSLINRRARA